MNGSEDRRNASRWVINEMVEFGVGDDSFDFRVVDASASGAKVAVDVDLEVGMDVRLKFTDNLFLAAKVVHLMPSSAGVEFQMEEDQQDQLLEWLLNSGDSSSQEMADS